MGNKQECMSAVALIPDDFKTKTAIEALQVPKTARNAAQLRLTTFLQANAIAKGILLESLHGDLKARYQREQYAKNIFDQLGEEFKNATSNAMKEGLDALRNTTCDRLQDWRSYVDKMTKIRNEIQLSSKSALHEETALTELRNAIKSCPELRAIHFAVCVPANSPTTWKDMVKEMTTIVDKTPFEESKVSLNAIDDPKACSSRSLCQRLPKCCKTRLPAIGFINKSQWSWWSW